MLMVSVERDNSWQSSRIKQRQKNCSVRGSVRTGGSNSDWVGGEPADAVQECELPEVECQAADARTVDWAGLPEEGCESGQWVLVDVRCIERRGDVVTNPVSPNSKSVLR
jgi:hypothetical protein